MGTIKTSIAEQIQNIEYVAAYMTDDQNRITVWNSNIEQLLGYSSAEIMDLPDSVLWLASFENTALGGAKFNWRKTKDGQKLFVLETVTVIEDPESSRYHTMKIVENYTDQLSFCEKMELWMQQHQEQDLIVVVNQRSLTMCKLSAGFIASLGYSLEELEGRPFETVISERSHTCEGTIDDLVVNSKRIHGLRFQMKDKSVFSATVSSFEMTDVNADGVQEAYWFAKILPSEADHNKVTEYFF